MRSLLHFLAVAVLAATSGCATLISGPSQTLSVEARHHGTVVADSSCTLENARGTWALTAPGSVVVNRSFSDLVVTCTHATLEKVRVVVKSVTGLVTMGNVFMIGGLIGAVIDADTGAAFDYPDLITVDFEAPPRPDPALAPSPAVIPVVMPAAPIL